jgi:hypothetical protein
MIQVKPAWFLAMPLVDLLLNRLFAEQVRHLDGQLAG